MADQGRADLHNQFNDTSVELQAGSESGDDELDDEEEDDDEADEEDEDEEDQPPSKKTKVNHPASLCCTAASLFASQHENTAHICYVYIAFVA